MVKKLATKKITVLIIGLLAIGTAGTAAYVKFNQSKNQPVSGSDFKPKADEHESTPPTVNSNQPNVPPGTSSQPQPQSSQSGQVTVTSPVPSSKIGGGTVVKGTAQVPELAYRVKSTKSGQLILGSAHTGGDSGKPSPYSFELYFEREPLAGDSGALEVFSYSPSGSEVNKVIIAVTF